MEPSESTDRLLSQSATVTLREITAETVVDICKLSVTPEQTNYVASNAIPIAEAHFAPEAWFRAIYADETPVGFVMLHQDTAKPEYGVWRFMVDTRYQGLGYGKQALLLVIDHVRTTWGNRTVAKLCYRGPRASSVLPQAGFCRDRHGEGG